MKKLLTFAIIIFALASCTKETFHPDTWGETQVKFINHTPDTLYVSVQYEHSGGYVSELFPNDTAFYDTYRSFDGGWITCWDQGYRVSITGAYYGDNLMEGTIHQWVYVIE